MTLRIPIAEPAPTTPQAERATAEWGMTAASVEEVYARHADFVFRSLRRLGVPEADVEDAVQEVFVVIDRRRAEFAGRSAMATWVFGIALRVAREARRSAARKRKLELAANSEPPRRPDMNPSESAERLEVAHRLEEALGKLDEERRAVLILAELEGMTMKEIADALAIKLTTVQGRLRLARRDFGEAVAQLGERKGFGQ